VPADAPVLASKVAACAFVYSPNHGATQQSGFVQLQLTLADGGESVALTLGAHVSNVP
jgi:MSHA biogenesis protein MshO